MKRKNQCCDFKQQKDDDLLKVFCEVMAQDHGNYKDIYVKVVRHRAQRFYVSEETCKKVLMQMWRGTAKFANENYSRMYHEIECRVSALLQRGVTLNIAIIRVVNSPAPEFYMTPGSALVRIFHARRRKFDRQFKSPLDRFRLNR